MTLAQELEAFIDSKGFKHFRGAELTPYWSRTRGSVTNDVPPRDLWPNVLPTLRVLDELRERLGAPLRLLSTYRSPDYNRAVGGERQSYHMKFVAIDFTCTTGKPDAWADVLKVMRKEGVFRGGIGVYPRSGFVHVDTRGYEANWRG